MPYLTVDPEQLRVAWDLAEYKDDAHSRELTAAERLNYGRRAVTTHLPQMLLQRLICRNCYRDYPCFIALWGMGLLKDQGWQLSDVVDLTESLEAGERS